MAIAIGILKLVACVHSLQAIFGDREGCGILDRFHEGRILGHDIFVARGEDETVIGRANPGGMIGRCRNSIESKPKDLSSTLKFELELDGFSNPFINWATLPVIDGFI